MQYVSEEVAKKIELAVERIKSGKYAECPAEHGIGKNTINGEVNFCPKRYLVTGRVIDPSRDCPPCWREACLDYIREHAPTDKVEGAEYIAIEPSSPCTTTAVPAGDILTLSHDDKTDRPRFTDATGGQWWVWLKSVRRISSLTAPEQPEPEEKPEPVKLYCVKAHEPGEWLTRGKVYEYTDGGTPQTQIVQYDACTVGRMHWSERTLGGRKLTEYLAPLVSRPAKVGEWVYLLCDPSDWDNKGRHQKGDIVLITHFWSLPSVKVDGKTVGFLEHEYLVLDGYDGRYETQPTDAHALRTENAMLERDNARLEEINRNLENDIDEQRRQLDDLRERIYNAKKALEGGK